MRWIEKTIYTFRIVTTFSLSTYSLGEIELRASAVGAKIDVFCTRFAVGLLVYYQSRF